MKKILYSFFTITSITVFGQSVTEVNPSLISNPVLANQSKTYTSCGYLQEGNALENGYQSSTNAGFVYADAFIVPAGECWDVSRVIAPFFVSFVTDPHEFIVTFYNDGGTAPGSIISTTVVTSADFTSTYKGSNYGYDVFDYALNLSSTVNVCGGGSGQTFWISVQGNNSISLNNVYWETTTLGTYGNNSQNAGSSAGPWSNNGFDMVYELEYALINNLTLTECEGFSITVGSTTYNSSVVVSETLTAVGGCDSIVNLDLTILPSATGTDVQTACESYLWIDGNTYTSDNNTATHTLAGAAFNGCDSIVTLDLDINGPDNGISQTGSVLSADQAGATYQWLDCNNAYSEILGQTAQNINIPTNGSYAVEVTFNSCVDTTACITISDAGILSSETSFVKVYPNPASNVIFVSGLDQLTGFTEMSIIAVNGDVLATYSKPANQISLDGLAAGVYAIKIIHETGIETIRFVKE